MINKIAPEPSRRTERAVPQSTGSTPIALCGHIRSEQPADRARAPERETEAEHSAERYEVPAEQRHAEQAPDPREIQRGLLALEEAGLAREGLVVRSQKTEELSNLFGLTNL